MTVALDPNLPPGLLSHLIVADIAPSRGAVSSEFQGYIEAMKKIEESGVKTRQEADRVLKPYEQVCLPNSACECTAFNLSLALVDVGSDETGVPAHEPRTPHRAPSPSPQIPDTRRPAGRCHPRDWRVPVVSWRANV